MPPASPGDAPEQVSRLPSAGLAVRQPDAPEGIWPGQSIVAHRPAHLHPAPFGSSGLMHQSAEVPVLLHGAKAAASPSNGGPLQHRLSASFSAGAMSIQQPPMQSSIAPVLRESHDCNVSALTSIAPQRSTLANVPLPAVQAPRTFVARLSAAMMPGLPVGSANAAQGASVDESTALGPTDTPVPAGTAFPTADVEHHHGAAPDLEASGSIDAGSARSTLPLQVGHAPVAESAHDGEEAAVVQRIPAGGHAGARAQRRVLQRQGAWGRWWPPRSRRSTSSAVRPGVRSKPQRRWSMILQVLHAAALPLVCQS